MTLVPPAGWSEVATKRDLAELEARLTASSHELEARFTAAVQELKTRLIATVHETIHSSMLAMNRSTILAVVGSVSGSATLSLAATRLGG